jgi:putative Holliday junction resolvase
MRVLAVDHGERRIGLAVSDPTGTLARPLTVLEHRSKVIDAARVSEAAAEQDAGLIVVGQSLDEEGRPNAAGRRAEGFAAALRSQTAIPIVLWDESMSTQDARAARLAAGVTRKGRGAAVDAEAAAVILQSYLGARSTSTGPRDKE